MKIYISGKISGIELNEARSKFAAAEKDLISAGYEAVNPMKISEYHPDKKWHEYMIEDIKALFECDGLLLLPCWNESKGARIEKAIADEIGLKIFNYTDSEIF